MAKNDFFLDPDESQTMGDINYMRKSKKIRHTFPKTLKNPDGFAIEKSISSEQETEFSGTNQGFQANNYQSQTSFNSAPAPASSAESKPAPAPTPNRKLDSGMDMFRNMAKNIGKR